MDSREIEAQDRDIIESAVVAFKSIKKRKSLIILVTIAGFLLSIIAANLLSSTTHYYSSATLFSAAYGSDTDTRAAVAAMNKYTSLIGSLRVCNRAAQELNGYDVTSLDLQDMVKSGEIVVSGASSNSLQYGYQITIAVYADSPNLAVPIANAMSTAFAAELNELVGSSAIQVMDEAVDWEAYNRISPIMLIIMVTGAMFVMSCILVFCSSFFSGWVQSVNQCEQNEDLILGLLPLANDKK